MLMQEKGFAPIIVLFLLVVIAISGIVGYFLGQKDVTKSSQSSTVNNDKANQIKLADYENKLSRLTKFENVGSLPPIGGVKIAFKCYRSDELPDNARITIIKQELVNDKRIINGVCADPENTNFIVDSYVLKDDSKKVEQRVDFDKFTEPDFVTTEFLYHPEIPESEIRYFKLNSWFNNNDFVFSLIQSPNGGPMAGNANSGTIMTYFKTENETDPKLVEYCNWGVAGGTSARYISSCTRFTTNKDSLYLQGKDLVRY